jgi:hypothetical protein
LLGTLKANLQGMIIPLQTEMIQVAEKFESQLQQLISTAPNPEESEPLQERVKKASEYFSGKLDVIIGLAFSAATFDTDNKAIRKSINDAADKLRKEIEIKKVCLAHCNKGFSIKTYLETKSKAAIEVPETGKKSSSSGSSASSFTMHPEFYTQLKKWRSEKADLLNVEISKIIPQKTLHEIVQTLPATRADLKSVKGMGGTRIKHFGKDILELVIAYRRQKGMDLPIGAEKEAETAALSSPQISFELFKSGKTIMEVAREREMAVSTIEGHLAQFVGTGEIQLDQVVDPQKSKAILDYIENHKTRGSNEIRAGLGNDYSYSEIRFVFKYLEANR